MAGSFVLELEFAGSRLPVCITDSGVGTKEIREVVPTRCQDGSAAAIVARSRRCGCCYHVVLIGQTTWLCWIASIGVDTTSAGVILITSITRNHSFLSLVAIWLSQGSPWLGTIFRSRSTSRIFIITIRIALTRKVQSTSASTLCGSVLVDTVRIHGGRMGKRSIDKAINGAVPMKGRLSLMSRRRCCRLCLAMIVVLVLVCCHHSPGGGKEEEEQQENDRTDRSTGHDDDHEYRGHGRTRQSCGH